MEQPPVTTADVDDLVVQMREAASAYIAGNMQRYFDVMRHTDDFTLMSPFGGEATRESASSITPARLAELEDFFKGGQCELEVVETYASGDLVVLVVVERQHGLVGHLPPQDWSLRVTLVFRRDHRVWRLVHRHADPLVHPINFDQLAALARG
jgi:ketosteroid isomerase-like protein